ncbi:c-type cytochrome [Pseudocnuella soli]|uniref:c-type cytochrome n=1 Tax=Pseudocnuella soli TaxID=2502779 RepID=UPI00104CAC73|nr:diheme cytochrome c-553 [Pseudocnuella soli]
MNKLAIITAAFALIVTAGIAATSVAPKTPSTRNEGLMMPKAPADSLLKRGEYLVTIMGCDDCHTPKKMGPHGPEPDASRRFMGHPANQPLARIDTAALRGWVLFDMGQTAAVGPWGISYAANISSDATGIGSWTEAQFFTAIRKGKFKGLEASRPMLPPMPWTQYAKASDEDLKAIFAYLKSSRPMANVVPQAVPPTQILSLK